ncbi:MmgE/PrpD family protein [Streptomyces sp. HNM0663]|uniref:MmgE/PrpD family protein n=1 Tax=Streptomyces chengmaiensis TaxID=3040919 RepID=A0ABT6HND2_9ACTN|nr:MmgE/PrpD family protein [Streptomyces chengmaiensis]MDH2390203.1 MmgE/PrpD family protein [Streptomyces chengmaiensis]
MAEAEKELARYTRKLANSRLNEEELHTIKRSVIDSYAGICASLTDRELLGEFRRMAMGPGAGSGSAVWGIGQESNIIDAVFLNSILARRSDLLNTYSSPYGMGGVHPSDNVALAFTLADWLNWSGRQFLESVNIFFRLAATFTDHYDPEASGFDHDAAAVFWTALTVGQAFNLSEDQLAEAQRIAGGFGFSSNQAAVGDVTDWKHCTYASCAMRGLQAARLARAGFTGPRSIYQGEFGADHFFRHREMSLDSEPDLTQIIFKRWPALFFCQTPIDVALELSSRIDAPEDIRAVTVETYGRAIRNGLTSSAFNPISRAGRTHSLPYCVATALLKAVEYSDFDSERAHDPQLRRLLEKIDVTEDPAMTQRFPPATPCRISVTLHTGEVIRHEREFSRGDPHDPLSDDEVSEKLRRNLDHLATSADCRGVLPGLWDLERLDDLAELLAPLTQDLTSVGSPSGPTT